VTATVVAPVELVPYVEFDVIGLPGPQGSKNTFTDQSGKVQTKESSAKVRPWRADVAWAVRLALRAKPPLTGPVALSITYYLPAPKNAPLFRRWKSKTPDKDKLDRATFDGLKTGGLWVDDARAVTGVSTKYLSRGVTGAHIVAWDLEAVERAGSDLVWEPRLVDRAPPVWRPDPTRLGGAR